MHAHGCTQKVEFFFSVAQNRLSSGSRNKWEMRKPNASAFEVGFFKSLFSGSLKIKSKFIPIVLSCIVYHFHI